MHHHRFPGRLSLLLILAGLLLPPAAAAQQNMDDVQIQTIPVADGVYMLLGRGGNIGLSVGSDGAFVVDDQYAPLSGKIQAAIAAVTDQPLRFVVNTHWHGDHTGGNESMGEAGAIIVAHENVRERMSTEQFLAAFNQRVPASPTIALPVITFTDAVTFYWNDDDIHIFHVANAHTDGDGIVHYRGADVIHMGDTFFNGFYPFIDVSSGGSIDGMIAAANRVLTIAGPATKIIPGHGPLTDRAGLVAYRNMLEDVRTRMLSLIAEGKTVDEVLAATPTAAYDATWGGGFMNPEQWVRIVYSSLNPE